MRHFFTLGPSTCQSFALQGTREDLAQASVSCCGFPRRCSQGAGAGARRTRGGGSFRRIVGIVTAFTLGHSLTLAAALGVPRLLFPGRESSVAAGFGLVHGLAFATVLASTGTWPLSDNPSRPPIPLAGVAREATPRSR
ncbi:hypothetical protein [Corallococcus terminator]|uniref:hypothetical protein n=1 Tax=Corallococcus terminator TaxID=2316733 RepID=UPI001ABF8BAF|nr:hypothetical protein [Corallococcus terminator]